MKKTTFQPCERLVVGKLASYLRPRFLLASILLVITMSTVSEADCWEDSLSRVNKDILVMTSGAVYQVVPRDAMNSAFWLSVLKLPFEGQSILSTVAIHTARNSYFG